MDIARWGKRKSHEGSSEGRNSLVSDESMNQYHNEKIRIFVIKTTRASTISAETGSSICWARRTRIAVDARNSWAVKMPLTTKITSRRRRVSSSSHSTTAASSNKEIAASQMRYTGFSARGRKVVATRKIASVNATTL